MKYLPLALIVAVGVATGVAGLVHGEADDSPGLQLLGVLLALGAMALGARSARRLRQQ